MGRETDRRHLLVKRQCSAQFGIRSTACRVMFPQQSLETKRCEVMLGGWFLSSIGANALQVTLRLNFGGEGVVPGRRGLNISSIYSSGARASSTAFSETPKFEEYATLSNKPGSFSPTDCKCNIVQPWFLNLSLSALQTL